MKYIVIRSGEYYFFFIRNRFLLSVILSLGTLNELLGVFCTYQQEARGHQQRCLWSLCYHLCLLWQWYL